MASNHCRYCDGEFASVAAYDRHLIRYKDMESEPWNGYNGRPICKGQRQARPFIDPNLVRLREVARKRFQPSPGERTDEKAGR